MNLTTVSEPNSEYQEYFRDWQVCRAACEGSKAIKKLDYFVKVSNLLIPFSPSMTQPQYNFYKSEAEWPGISSQFARILVGGLLRKPPTIQIESPEILDWIQNDFGQDGSTLTAFLDEALFEEIKTSRAWVYVTYPNNPNSENLSPYPILWKADSVINWHKKELEDGSIVLSKVIVKGYTEDYTNNEFHPELKETVWVHEINEEGYYQIRVFLEGAEIETIEDITAHGEKLSFIPAWPLNGSIDCQPPILTPIIDKEITLYNKMSRRNHLLYGAATYTPIIKSDMPETEFLKIVDNGLGTWIQLGKDESADILKTPTDALKNMEDTISNTIEEIARLGIRMLSPETAQSGIALQLRNASQAVQLGSLNSRISVVLKQIVEFMIYWRYGNEEDIEFSLTEDFDPIPIGEEWLRLATEWYERGLIPRTAWLRLLKQNDMISPDYNDEEAEKELNEDPFKIPVDNDYERKYRDLRSVS